MSLTKENSFESIVGCATAPGRSAISLIRVSGNREHILKIIKNHFQLKGEPSPALSHPGQMKRALFFENLNVQKNALDDVMICWFEGPHSYTGDDVLEIYCHGNPVLVREIIGALQQSECRLAEPGEFSKRAFLNGKMDLIQAESVCQTINAQSKQALLAIRSQNEGQFSNQVKSIRKRILDLLSWIEADIDFGDREVDDVVPLPAQNLKKNLKVIMDQIDHFSSLLNRSRILQDGLKIILLGKPNVGKSSLLNLLCGKERALVDHEPGTTRDYLEASFDLEGIPCQVIDTAGFNLLAKDVELKGIEKTKNCLEKAHLVLAIFDQSRPLNKEDQEMIHLLKGQHIPLLAIQNKIDLPLKFKNSELKEFLFPLEKECKGIVHISALTKSGFGELLNKLSDNLKDILGAEEFASEAVITARQGQIFSEVYNLLQHAYHTLEKGFGMECITFDLRNAINGLSRMLGREIGKSNQPIEMEEVLDQVFSKFCIGK